MRRPRKNTLDPWSAKLTSRYDRTLANWRSRYQYQEEPEGLLEEIRAIQLVQRAAAWRGWRAEAWVLLVILGTVLGAWLVNR